MNPPLLSEMSFGINFFKHPTIIFIIILYEALQRDMGGNLQKLEGLDSFGTKASKEEFMLPPYMLFFLTNNNIHFRSHFIISQKNL